MQLIVRNGPYDWQYLTVAKDCIHLTLRDNGFLWQVSTCDTVQNAVSFKILDLGSITHGLLVMLDV